MMRRSMDFCAGGVALGFRRSRRLSVVLGLASVFAACASRNPEVPASRDAQALLKASPTLTSVALVHMDSRDTLYRFTPDQVDSLKAALKKSFVSESLSLTPSSWPVALVLRAKGDDARSAKSEGGSHAVYIALHYGAVLRVNNQNPWSSNIADSTGAVFASGVADIVLDADDVVWIHDLVQDFAGKLPSNPQHAPGIPLKPLY